MTINELDVRGLRKPDKHPAIFARYRELDTGASFVLVNDHDPRHLHDEFEAEYPGSFGWEYVEAGGTGEWRITITKLSSTPLPRVLTNTATLCAAAESEAVGAIWTIPVHDRDLDSNVIRLPPGGSIDAYTGPDIDVLIHVIDGTGHLITERGVIYLALGDVVWLPRHSIRHFTAGPDGIRYLTVHRRRQALTLDSPAPRAVESIEASGAS